MNKILARRVKIITKGGELTEYTHVTYIEATLNILSIAGERDDVDGSRISVNESYPIRSLHVMDVHFYKPPE